MLNPSIKVFLLDCQIMCSIGQVFLHIGPIHTSLYIYWGPVLLYVVEQGLCIMGLL